MKELEALQAALKYSFSDRGILLQALTHTSYGHEHFPKRPLALRDNERLEFLGDAILDRIVHNAYRLELDGPSMRKLKAAEATEPSTPPVATPAADGKPPKGAKK